MTINYIISGRVQGVGFRFWTKQLAIQYNISGYTRNLPSGQVEVVVRGKDSDLKKFEQKLREGPPLAKIDSIDRAVSNENTISDTDFAVL